LPYKTFIVLSEKQIRTIFLTHYPNLEIKSINEFSQSFINPVFLIKTSASQEYILKINNPHWPNKQRREIAAMDIAREKTSVPIPKVLASSFDKDIIPYDYMIQEKLPGRELREAIKSPDFTEQNFLTIIEQLGIYLGELHSIHFDFFGDFVTDCLNNGKVSSSSQSSFWNNRFDSWRSCFRAFCYDNLNWVDITSFPQYRKQLREKIEFFSEKIAYTDSACFTHSDIQPSNILVQGDQITGLIDFEWSYAGSANFDYTLVLAGLYFSSFPSVEQSQLMSTLSPQSNNLQKDIFNKGYQKSCRSKITEETVDLMDFIWLLYMVGSWDWAKKSSSSEEILGLEKSVHKLFKKFAD